MKTTTNTGKNQKFFRKVQEEGVEVLLSQWDPLNVFAKPMGTINIR